MKTSRTSRLLGNARTAPQRQFLASKNAEAPRHRRWCVGILVAHIVLLVSGCSAILCNYHYPGSEPKISALAATMSIKDAQKIVSKEFAETTGIVSYEVNEVGFSFVVDSGYHHQENSMAGITTKTWTVREQGRGHFADIEYIVSTYGGNGYDGSGNWYKVWFLPKSDASDWLLPEGGAYRWNLHVRGTEDRDRLIAAMHILCPNLLKSGPQHTVKLPPK